MLVLLWTMLAVETWMTFCCVVGGWDEKKDKKDERTQLTNFRQMEEGGA